MKEDPIIDLESVLERIGSDYRFLIELIEVYIEDFSQKYDQMKKAAENHDFGKIQEIAHYMKGSSSNLSLSKLLNAASELELAGEEQDKARTIKNLSYLFQEFKNLKKYFLEIKPVWEANLPS